MPDSMHLGLLYEANHTYAHTHTHTHAHTHTHTEKNFVKARDHFLYACQPEDYGAMLVEFATSKGYPSEAELFVSQAVLQ